MEIKPASNPTKVATKWAVISLLISIVITYIIQFANLDINSPLKYLGYIPFLACLFLTQKEFRDELGGFLTFNEGFSAGFRYSVFNGLLMAVFTYLYITILSPEYFAKSLEKLPAAWAEKGMSQEQIDKAMEMTKKWSGIGGAFFVAIAYAILGAIVSLVGAAIFKKVKLVQDIPDQLDTDATV
jgi:hypothetical protein